MRSLLNGIWCEDWLRLVLFLFLVQVYHLFNHVEGSRFVCEKLFYNIKRITVGRGSRAILFVYIIRK